MSRPSLLIAESPLQVLPSLAKSIGLNEAIVLQQIQYWIAIEQGEEREGRRWIYNSVEQWRKQFPFWSADTIQRTLQSLRDKGLVDAQKLSSDKWKHTLYYSINYNKLQDCIAASCGKGLRESAESITADCNSMITASCTSPLPQVAAIIPTENTQRLPKTSAEKPLAENPPMAKPAVAPASDPFLPRSEREAKEATTIAERLKLNPEWEVEARRRSEGKQNPQAYFDTLIVKWDSGEWTAPTERKEPTPPVPPRPPLPAVFQDCLGEDVPEATTRLFLLQALQDLALAGKWVKGDSQSNPEHVAIAIAETQRQYLAATPSARHKEKLFAQSFAQRTQGFPHVAQGGAQ